MAARRIFRCVVAALIAAALAALVVPEVRAASIEHLPVPAVTIYPGDTIAADMLADGKFPPGTTANYPVIPSPDALIGKVARRTLLPGRPIARNTVAEPELVQKGKIISAVYRHGALTITASVLALQSGALDDTIQVRNIDSGKVIVGTVRSDGTIGIEPK
jgi:flagella basal body P-ring formation protein FlgA